MVNNVTVENPQLHSLAAKVFDEFTYFTVQISWMVVITSLYFAFRPHSMSTRWHCVRFMALVMIAMTGICYYLLVASELHYTGIIKVGDVCAHLVSPILYVATWLIFGPRGFARRSGVVAVAVYLVAWTMFTLVRGHFTDIYPYGFTDVGENGLVSVLTMAGMLTVFGVVIAIAALGFDRWRVRRTITSPSTDRV